MATACRPLKIDFTAATTSRSSTRSSRPAAWTSATSIRPSSPGAIIITRFPAAAGRWPSRTVGPGDATAASEYRLVTNPRLTPAAALLEGLHGILGETPLLAYLVSLTRRIAAIWRVLAPTGTFYLHCDPSASHYLKLVCDGIFCSQGGEFRNEIIWHYETGGRSARDFAWKHDIILRYAKSKTWTFDAPAVHLPRPEVRRNHMKRGVDATRPRLRIDHVRRQDVPLLRRRGRHPPPMSGLI